MLASQQRATTQIETNVDLRDDERKEQFTLALSDKLDMAPSTIKVIVDAMTPREQQHIYGTPHQHGI